MSANTPKPRKRAKELETYSTERTKAFIDAAIAIAATLLILPLMESVYDITSDDETTLGWLQEQGWDIGGFVISFALVVMFWFGNQSLYSRVDLITQRLYWLLALWMLTIVWLPVASALMTRMAGGDPILLMVYLVSLLLTAVAQLFQRLYIRAHPTIHHFTNDQLNLGLASDITNVVLFVLVLAIALLVPAVGLWALLLMFLSHPMQELVERMLRGTSLAVHEAD